MEACISPKPGTRLKGGGQQYIEFEGERVRMKTTPAELAIQMPEAAKADHQTMTMSGPLIPLASRANSAPAEEKRRFDLSSAALRLACLISSAISLSLMVTSDQRGNLSVFGLEIPLRSSWSYSDSLEYLVVVSSVGTAYSLLQLLLIARTRMLVKGPTVPSRGQAWILFIADQVFAYAMISAGSAAAGVTNLNRTGIRHAALPNFCKPLPRFCNHAAVSIAFAFLSFMLLAASAVLDVLQLANY